MLFTVELFAPNYKFIKMEHDSFLLLKKVILFSLIVTVELFAPNYKFIKMENDGFLL
jgi:hypothetical protein